jgi:hypothetical protein
MEMHELIEEVGGQRRVGHAQPQRFNQVRMVDVVQHAQGRGDGAHNDKQHEKVVDAKGLVLLVALQRVQVDGPARGDGDAGHLPRGPFLTGPIIARHCGMGYFFASRRRDIR